LDVALAQSAFDAIITAGSPRLIAATANHLLDRQGLAQSKQFGFGVSRQHSKLAIQRLVQSAQGMMQPPARHAAHLPSPGIRIVKNVEGSTGPNAAAEANAGLSASRRS